MKKYPDFEEPAVHVAEANAKNDPKGSETILNAVLAKNPLYYDALNAMATVKVAQHDSTASMAYTMKAFRAASGEGDGTTKIMEGALTKMQEDIKKAEKELKARKAKEHDAALSGATPSGSTSSTTPSGTSSATPSGSTSAPP